MRILSAIAFACLALTGCQTAKLDEDIQKNLPAICAGASQAHRVYEVAVIAGKVSAKDQQRVDAAWVAMKPLCIDPPNQSSASVVAAAFVAYVTISSVAH